jgi:formylglycine-generating enzyme required for sulfatase activity
MRLLVSFLRSVFVLAGLALLAAPASAVTIDWVTVGAPVNPADTATNCYAADCGSVSYEYFISTYEVTNAQYAEFLNAKAADNADPLGLYSTAMAGITRSGSPGTYVYTVNTGFADKPVNYVSFYDALRFTNWLNNGQGDGDTETGAYTLLGGTATPSNGTLVLRNPDADIFLPSENEWYKAAYWDPGTQGFLDFPAGSNDPTVCAAPGATPNTANCDVAAGGVTDVGAYTGSASPYGTFDQGGNVWEWNEQIVSGSERGLRGGSWSANALNPAASSPSEGSPDYWDAQIGFRVASFVPEPDASPLAMIVLTGLAARQERRKRNL